MAEEGQCHLLDAHDVTLAHPFLDEAIGRQDAHRRHFVGNGVLAVDTEGLDPGVELLRRQFAFKLGQTGIPETAHSGSIDVQRWRARWRRTDASSAARRPRSLPLVAALSLFSTGISCGCRRPKVVNFNLSPECYPQAVENSRPRRPPGPRRRRPCDPRWRWRSHALPRFGYLSESSAIYPIFLDKTGNQLV